MPKSCWNCTTAAVTIVWLVSAPVRANADQPLQDPSDTGSLARAAASTGLRMSVLQLAIWAHARAQRAGLTDSPRLTVIDYSLPSRVPRLWVLDLVTGRVLAHELVAHGRGTGGDMARHFSNHPGSFQSSLGTFITGETYHGQHGLALRLRGIDPGLNDHAEARAIVIHGADYVNTDVIGKLGHLGRSQGCPALSLAAVTRVIPLIRSGTVLFAYAPSPALKRTQSATGSRRSRANSAP